jgi:peptide/nickel transport system ATP-binding protein
MTEHDLRLVEPPLVALNGVRKTYVSAGEPVHALDGVDFTIPARGAPIIAVAGESGSGKTTLASLLLGFETPTAGSVHYQGVPVSDLDAQARRRFRREVQAVFQDPFAVYNPFYKVDRALQLPIRRFGLASKRDERALMEEACASVGLNARDTLGRYPHQLSGGQRQRLMIARAMLLKPKLLIADEPVSMVDASLRATILGALRTLNRSYQLPIAYITHDLTTAFHVADAIVILYRGRVVEAGDTEAVIRRPLHPYTRLLVDSIAWADRDRAWGQGEPVLPSQKGVPSTGDVCTFAPRCPYRTSQCLAERPPLRHTTATHVSACVLHSGGVEASPDTLGRIVSLTVTERTGP